MELTGRGAVGELEAAPAWGPLTAEDSLMAHVLWQLGENGLCQQALSQAGGTGIQEREEGLSFQLKTWTSVVC